MQAKQSKMRFILPELVLSTVGAVVGYVLTNSTIYNLCTHDQYDCREVYNHIGDPLIYGMGALAIVFLFLLVVPQAFEKWKKFAIWFVPIAALFFIFYSDPKGMDMFSPYAEQVYRWIAITYIAISLALIGSVKFKGKK